MYYLRSIDSFLVIRTFFFIVTYVVIFGGPTNKQLMDSGRVIGPKLNKIDVVYTTVSTHTIMDKEEEEGDLYEATTKFQENEKQQIARSRFDVPSPAFIIQFPDVPTS